ncbi:MAG: extracellular solute-binding protein [Clostridiales Family XIII bacterium]|jgi:raffinose/stachyose/melibiose transport system substrate-binding protein|nr:extracellular solute-binding protein [Clostridiales Family XIII bacterium]
MKKILGLVLCFAVLVGTVSFAACGGGGGAEGNQIVAWDLANGSADVAKKAAVENFNASSEIKITLEQFENDQYKEKIQADMANGEGPDLIYGWGQTGIMKRWVDAGEIADLTGKVDTLLDKVVDSVAKGCVFDGKTYGVPIESTQPIIMYYNKKLFKKINAEYPKTWEEFLALIPKFRDANIVPVSVAGGAAWTEMMWAEYLVDNIAGPDAFLSILDNDAGAWTNPDIVKAMTELEKFIKLKPFEDGYESVTPDQNGELALLCEDKAAMMLQGSWLTSTIANDYADAKDNIELGQFPFYEGGKGDATNLVGNLSNYWSVSAKADQAVQDAAIKFLDDEIFTESYVDELLAVDSIPPVKGIENKITNDKIKFLYEKINDADSFQLSWDQSLDPDASNVLLNGLTELFTGKTSAKAWCEMMDGTIQQ